MCLRTSEIPALLYITWEVTKIKLEILTNYDMLLMFEKGIRGGIAQPVQHYVKTNNKYMGDQYNSMEESSYLQYLDAKWAITQVLPTWVFGWEKKVELFTATKIARLVKKNKKSYV